MGVTTRSDELRREAEKHLDVAIPELKKVYDALDAALDKETWGSTDYNEEYLTFLRDAYRRIGEIRHELREISFKM